MNLPINISTSALLNAPNGGASGGVGASVAALTAGTDQDGQSADLSGAANLFASLLDLLGQGADTQPAAAANAVSNGTPTQTSQSWMNIQLGDLETALNTGGDNDFMAALAALLGISGEGAAAEDENEDPFAPAEPGAATVQADAPDSPIAGIIEQLTGLLNNLAGRLESAEQPAPALTSQAAATVKVAEYLLQRLGGVPGAATGQPGIVAPETNGTPTPNGNAPSSRSASAPGLPASTASSPAATLDPAGAPSADAGKSAGADVSGDPDLAARLRTLSADLGALKQNLPAQAAQTLSTNTAATVAPTLADLLLATKGQVLQNPLLQADAAGDDPLLAQTPAANTTQRANPQSALPGLRATSTPGAGSAPAPTAPNTGKAALEAAQPASGSGSNGSPDQPELAEPGTVAKDLRPTMNTAPNKAAEPSTQPNAQAALAVAANDPATNPQMTTQVTNTGAPTISADSTAGARPMQAAYQPPQVNLPQLAFEISRQFQANNHRFEIRMDPPELGRIDVRLDVDRQGAVHARLAVERPETLDMLQRDARALERALAQAGLDSSKTSLEFSLRQNPHAGQQSGGEGNQGGSGNPATTADAGNQTEDGVPAAQAINAYQGIASPGGVNLWV